MAAPPGGLRTTPQSLSVCRWSRPISWVGRARQQAGAGDSRAAWTQAQKAAWPLVGVRIISTFEHRRATNQTKRRRCRRAQATMSTVWPWVSIGHRDNVIVIVPGCEHHPGRCKDDACGEQRVHHAHQIGVPWFVHTGRAAAGGSGHTRLTLSAWACYFTRVNLNTASQNNFACSLQNVFTQLKYDTASCPAPPRTSMLEHTPWVTCNDMRSAPLGPSAWNVDHGMTLCTSGPMAYTTS